MTAPDHQPAWQPSALLADAAAYAFELHRGDVRKSTRIPYIAHLLSVCGLVIADGGSEAEAAAALLHDALEDHPERTSRAEIARRFGDAVAAIVAGCSDTPEDYTGGPKPPWRERKARYLAHLQHADAATLRVAMADKLDNARAMLADHRAIGDTLWARFNAGKDDQLWYLESLVATFEARGQRGMLAAELRETVSALKAASR